MTKTKKIVGIILTIILTALLGLLYYSIENFFHSDFGCGCSSTCRVYYPVLTSRLVGYSMMTSSVVLFIASVWKFKDLSRWWTILATLIFSLAFYGNGFMIFNKGVCGYSLNKATFFINQTKLGDFAKSDGETINLDSLDAGKYKGKLLGYSFKGNKLKIFKIGDEPEVLSTRFLFWKIRNNIILNDFSYGLNSFRNFEVEKTKGHYEFIGGQGMTEKDFLDEFILTQKDLTINLKNKRIINHNDGTTRFIFETN
ncbi:MAG TPA: hypothetical protein PLL09_07000 [Flavobacterium sp.]|uniref:hypothetical protein n=2 Tax=Flavobacterium TaxID=237 RepID=UPI0025BE1903|nr:MULTISPECIES: hypothetical protein [unclassified Flavobacterium]HRE77555.1 hypothetical protein [Flavobacterium sp.]